MRSKKFNEVRSYTYWIKHLETGIKYVGLRYNNVTKNRSPLQDFGIHYFTSGRLKEEFKLNPKNFKTKLLFTYDTIEEAIKDELQLTQKAVKDNRYSNIASYPFIQPTEEIRKKLSIARLGKKFRPLSEEHRKKIANSLKGKTHSEQRKKNIAIALRNLPEEFKNATRKQISEANKGRPSFWKGKTMPEETKKKISDALMGQESPRKGKTHSEESKKKMSEAKKGKPSNNKGKSMSEEQKKKISDALMGQESPRKGKTHSEESKKKISLTRKGQKMKPMSEEHKRKISDANKGRKLSEESRKKISEARKNMSDETKRKISDTLKGRKLSEETRKKISEAGKRREATKKAQATLSGQSV